MSTVSNMCEAFALPFSLPHFRVESLPSLKFRPDQRTVKETRSNLNQLLLMSLGLRDGGGCSKDLTKYWIEALDQRLNIIATGVQKVWGTKYKFKPGAPQLE
jgi:hypothetical protein